MKKIIKNVKQTVFSTKAGLHFGFAATFFTELDGLDCEHETINSVSINLRLNKWLPV